MSLLLIMASGNAFAQIEHKWLGIGALESPYSGLGTTREQEPGNNLELRYPAIDRESGNLRSSAMRVGARNFTDADGRHWDYKVVSHGPRQDPVAFVPMTFETRGRFMTQVTVDGAESFRRFVVFDSDPDPSLPSERQLVAKWTTSLGLQFERTAHAWSQEYHDNYHIIEYTITNTGDVNGDGTAELNAPLEGVYVFLMTRTSGHMGSAWSNNNANAWGQQTMNDAVGDGHEDYGVDFFAQYAWSGHAPDRAEWSILGGPMMGTITQWSASDDSLGRLANAQMLGTIYLHADTGPGNPDNDPGQPSTTLAIGTDHSDWAHDEFNADQMARIYRNWMEGSTQVGGNRRMYPHHADLVQPDGNFTYGTNAPNTMPGPYVSATSPYMTSSPDAGGVAYAEAYGPYNLAIGQSVHFVQARAVAGLNTEAREQIGRQYQLNNRRGLPEPTPITWNGISKSKNEWVMTTKDSLFQTFQRARANYESGFKIPDPPRPPATFSVTSSPDKISLAWTLFAGEPEPGQFEIWRGANRFDDPGGYSLLATVPGSARSYDDNAAQRGIQYFYYIQAVAATANTDATGLTPTGVRLKSGRYHTQTYLPAALTRSPGAAINDVVIVPNPLSIAQAENDVRWPSQYATRLAFLEIPGQCTISIYTQLGELVKRIEHTNGSGDEFWNLATDGDQVIVSGLYIAHIKDNVTGAETIKKFTVIR